MIDEKLITDTVAQYFEEVLNARWLDLTATEVIWAIRVNNWRPLTVAMDSQGNNLYSKITERAQERLKELQFS